MTAVLEGLKYLDGLRSMNNCEFEVKIFSDSKYLVNGMMLWIEGWARNQWRKKDKKPVMNDDIWREIHELMGKMSIESEHVKGHSGHPENEECDLLAVSEIEKRQ